MRVAGRTPERRHIPAYTTRPVLAARFDGGVHCLGRNRHRR
ncbi:hypothetical protein BKA14_002171 [Actinoplanes abujensis]|uniref:Uncharacterized protein n=1 Tax=Paractinoplanes abujensis TaxID=882441 RepID=A0A7W7CNV3_9ACTN|nr:hypothetical protein [Actinoplanes abujensis]